jgi:hypothetical protein
LKEANGRVLAIPKLGDDGNMEHMFGKPKLILCAMFLLAAWGFGLRPLFTNPADAQQGSAIVEKDNEELARIFAEDQADRDPKNGQLINWAAVGPRDKERLARVREIYQDNMLTTGQDYYYSAMILQHGEQATDYLLAHELCVVSIGKGDSRARWLAAASEDRFLRSIGRPQRFGTQYSSAGPNTPYRLYNVEDGVTDSLRRSFDAPTLEGAKAREAEMNK